MDTLIPAELLKACGTILTAAVAVYAVYSDKLEKIQDGKLTRKGRILIGAAVLGLGGTLGAQIAQYAAALESAESTRKRSEQTSAKLDAVTDRLQLEALAATPFRRMTYIAYFQDGTAPAGLVGKDSFDVNITFMRGSQSEFRINAHPAAEGAVAGKLQLEGRDQRVSVLLDEGATYSGLYDHFRWQAHATTSMWVDLGFKNLVSAFEQSSEGKFDYWPYVTLADLKDVWILVEVSGALAPRLSASYLRLNEDLVIAIPPPVKNRVQVRNILESVRHLEEKT